MFRGLSLSAHRTAVCLCVRWHRQQEEASLRRLNTISICPAECRQESFSCRIPLGERQDLFFPRPMFTLVSGPRPPEQCQVQVPSHERGLNSSQIPVGYSHGIYADVIPAYHAGRSSLRIVHPQHMLTLAFPLIRVFKGKLHRPHMLNARLSFTRLQP